MLSGLVLVWFGLVSVPQETLTYMTQFLPWQTQRKPDLYWNVLVLLANISPSATSSAKAGPYGGRAQLSPGWGVDWVLLVCEKLSTTLAYGVKSSDSER